MIASLAFYVLDAVLDWPVVLYDASWSQWGQMSADGSKGGQLQTGSPWQTDIPTRSDFVVYNSDDVPGPVTFTGSGPNDMTAGGTYSGTSSKTFVIEIDGTGTPDTFQWSQDGGSTWTATGVSITGAAQTLQEGMTVTFTATTGHTLGDRWNFPTGAKKIVELLTLDGSVCSWQRSLVGVDDNNNPAGCTPLLPISFAGSANQVEEEDALYFGPGGGSGGGGGGGGGGPIVPGY